MGGDWGVYGFVLVMTAIVMLRLERLGKQIEAVSSRIRIDGARTEEERAEIMAEWKENQDTERKERRLFWVFWGIMLALAAGMWFFFQHPY